MIIPSIGLISAVYLGTLGILLASGVFLGVAAGLVAYISMLFLIQGGGHHLFVQLAYNQLHGFILTAVPVFVFMGEILLRTGISDKLYNSISVLMSRVPGRLLHVNVFSSAMFSAVSGTSTATVAAIGAVALPELQKRGYDKRMSLGSLAIAGTLGMMIPPSVAMILYSFLTGTSLSKLFMAGIVPGIILAFLFSAVIVLQSLKNPDRVQDTSRDDLQVENSRRISLLGKMRIAAGILPVVFLIVAIFGSIYMGIATPTEAAGVGVWGALLIALIQKKLTLKVIIEAAKHSAILNCIIGIILMGSLGMSFSISHLGVGRMLVETIASLDLSPTVVLILMYILYFILGCFMDGISLILVTVPLAYPIIVSLNFDPIWFGVVLVVTIELAMVTPPIGVNLWVLQGISGESMQTTVRGVLPFIVVLIGFLVLLNIFPQIATWLPGII